MTTKSYNFRLGPLLRAVLLLHDVLQFIVVPRVHRVLNKNLKNQFPWQPKFTTTHLLPQITIERPLLGLPLDGQIMGKLALVPLGALALLEKCAQDRLWVRS